MLVVFFSNYLTHHQIPFCEATSSLKDMEFYFISTEEMEKERLQGGWKLAVEYPYEIKAYESDDNKKRAIQLAEESDVMIIGSAPEIYLKRRMNVGKKLTFRYSERVYKSGCWRVLSPRGVFNRFDTFFRYFDKPLYMLCASAYTARDLAMLGSYIGRCYKWGYFPKTERYENFDELLDKKLHASILWVGRLIRWKHPDVSINMASRLKEEGVDFHLTVVGDGPLRQQLEDMVKANELQDNVTFTGNIPSRDVRRMMERHEIFISTSDYHEGWGAVINEAMNSGCAVVASSAMGATDFLIQDGENGFTYPPNSKGIKKMYECVKELINDSGQRKRISYRGYRTIVDEWNAENAANKFVYICSELMKGKKVFFENGVCSRARIFHIRESSEDKE